MYVVCKQCCLHSCCAQVHTGIHTPPIDILPPLCSCTVAPRIRFAMLILAYSMRNRPEFIYFQTFITLSDLLTQLE